MRRLLPVYATAAFVFLHVPLLVLAVFSVNSSRFTIWQGFSLRWYEAALQDVQLAEAAWNSLVIAVAATLLSTCIGTLCAYALWKRKSVFISGSLYTTLVTPEIVMGVSLLAFFQWIFRYLHVQLGMHTVVLAEHRGRRLGIRGSDFGGTDCGQLHHRLQCRLRRDVAF